ncbi:hypothetical protein THZB04_30030 [Vibrio owensii]|nr:hypothetical protein THZB04_30030 [Vibrio owensii]
MHINKLIRISKKQDGIGVYPKVSSPLETKEFIGWMYDLRLL